MVAVTKTVGPAIAQWLVDQGVPDLGESRPQELWKKSAVIQGPVRWHMIGHLQRNKIERTLPLASLIHSVDSLRLLEALNRANVGQNSNPAQRVGVLLEVNVSKEEAKHGFAPTDVPALASELGQFPNLNIAGLMTMAALTENPEDARPGFAELRRLRDQIRVMLGQPNALPELSMGMTQDFEVAIEEGATLVRIGSALFEGLPEPAA